MIALLAALGVVVGATAEIYLRQALNDQINGRLNELTTHGPLRSFEDRNDPYHPRTPPGSQLSDIFLTSPAISPVVGGVVVPDSSTGVYTFGPLPTGVRQQLMAVKPGRPVDMNLGDLGNYRVIAQSFVTRGTDERLLSITAVSLNPMDRTLTGVALATGGGVLVALGIAGWAGALIIRRTLRPLARVAATATKVSELKLDEGKVDLAQRVQDADIDDHTEVGQVGAALNRMLDHVSNALEARHASEMHVRQFVADASHELRTPLASILGYAELSRRRKHASTDEVTHMLSRVESEANRMKALVEDLLLLASLDAGRPLMSERVDLTALVINAVSDAHAAGPDHRWGLDLPEEPVTVIGDSARLQQILANLLANARTHTPEGTKVTAGLEMQPTKTLITVTDDGPGIPPEKLSNIFGRFVRGDSSRSRAAGSTGLGLAIVQAVAAAHGGYATAASRPGYTKFSVYLPHDSTYKTK